MWLPILLTGHWVDKLFQKVSAVLCVEELQGSHTGSHICEKFSVMLVGYWMVRVVVICSYFVLPLSLILLGDLPALMICQILPEQVDYIILLHLDLWTVFVEVGML